MVVAGLVVTVGQFRRIWFFGDDWNFLLDRSLTQDPAAALFEPHNEHWTAVPVLVYRALYSVVGLRHFLPYTGPVLLAHAVVCAMVWVLTRRAGAAPWAAVAGVAVVASAGVGAEDLLWPFQVSFIGSIAFGLLAFWAADHTGGHPLRDVAAAVAILLGFASSGMGVPMWLFVVVLLLGRRRWREILVVGGAPVVVYGLWFLTYGRDGTGGEAGPTDYLLLPQFVWRGLSTAWGGALGVPDAGPVVVVLALVALLAASVATGGRHPDLRRLALAGAAGAVVLYTTVGVSRLQFGIDQATASRYTYPAVVFGAFGLVALLTVLLATRDARSAAGETRPVDETARAGEIARADEPGPAGEIAPAGEPGPAGEIAPAGQPGPAAGSSGRRAAVTRLRPTPFAIALTVTLALVAVNGVRQLDGFADSRVALLATSRPQILGAVVLARDGAPVFTDLPDPMYTPDVTMQRLATPAVQQAFGPVTVTPPVLLDARAAVQTGIRSTDPGLPAPASLSWVAVAGGTEPSTSGCATGVARRGSLVDVTPGASGRAQVRLRGAGPMVQLRLIADGTTSTALLRTTGRDDVWIGTIVPDAQLEVVVLQDSPITVCAGAAAS